MEIPRLAACRPEHQFNIRPGISHAEQIAKSSMMSFSRGVSIESSSNLQDALSEGLCPQCVGRASYLAATQSLW